jgi:integrase
MGSVYKRGDIYWIRYRKNNKNLFESSKSEKKSVANELLKKREGRIVEGLDPGAGYDKLTYEALRKNLINDYIENNKKVERLNASLKHLDNYFSGFKINHIVTKEIKAYRTMRLNEGASNGTINRELAALKRIFNLGREDGMVDSVPHIPMLSEGDARKGFFEHDEYLELLKNLPAEIRSVVTFAYHTGWRKNEVVNLTWDKVDLKARTIYLLPEEVKNKDGRLIYMDDEIYNMLRLQNIKKHKDCNYVFHRDGQPIKDFRGAWKKACQDAGLSGKLFHDFRRTAVRNLTRSGVQETVAMKFTGHKTRNVFDRYNITNEDDLKMAANRHSEYLRNKSVTKTVTIDENNKEEKTVRQAQVINIKK